MGGPYRVADEVWADAEDLPMTDQPRRVPEHVLRAGAAAAASSALVKAVRAAESSATMPDPARGQLWRSCRGDITQLVLVLRVRQAGLAEGAPGPNDPPPPHGHPPRLPPR